MKRLSLFVVALLAASVLTAGPLPHTDQVAHAAATPYVKGHLVTSYTSSFQGRTWDNEIWQGTCYSSNNRYAVTARYQLIGNRPNKVHQAAAGPITWRWEVGMVTVSVNDLMTGTVVPRADLYLNTQDYAPNQGGVYRYAYFTPKWSIVNGNLSFFPPDEFPWAPFQTRFGAIAGTSALQTKSWTDAFGVQQFGVDYLKIDLPGGKSAIEGGDCGIYMDYGYPWESAPRDLPVWPMRTAVASTSAASAPESGPSHETSTLVGPAVTYFDNPNFAGSGRAQFVGLEGLGPAAAGCPDGSLCTQWTAPPIVPSGVTRPSCCSWTQGSPFTWSMRMEGTLTLARAVALYTNTTQRVQLYVNGALYSDVDAPVANEDYLGSYGEWWSGPWPPPPVLPAGTHRIRIDFLGSSSTVNGFSIMGSDGAFVQLAALQPPRVDGSTSPEIGAVPTCVNGNSRGFVAVSSGNRGAGWRVDFSRSRDFASGVVSKPVASTLQSTTIPDATSPVAYGFAAGETWYARAFMNATASYSNTVRVVGGTCPQVPPPRPTVRWQQCSATTSPRLQIDWPTTTEPGVNGFDVDISTSPNFATTFRARVTRSTFQAVAPTGFVNPATNAPMPALAVATPYYVRITSAAHQPSTSAVVTSLPCTPYPPAAPTLRWECPASGQPRLNVSWPSSTVPGVSGFDVDLSTSATFSTYQRFRAGTTTFGGSAPDDFRDTSGWPMVGLTYSATYYARVSSDGHTPRTSAVSVSPPPTCQPVAPTSAGVLGWWKGEGNLAATVGPNLDGVATFAPAMVGQGAVFDGGSVATAASFPAVSNGLTVEMWVRPTSSPLIQALATRWAFLGADNEHVFALFLGPGGVLDWWTDESSTRSPETLSGVAPQLLDGALHHVAASWDQREIRLYVDGVLVAFRRSQGGVLNAAPTVPLRIGGAGPGAPFFYSGVIDEPTVYARSLTEGEVRGIVAAGPAGKPAT